MPRRSPEERIPQLQAELSRLQALAKKEERRLDTRRKILFGVTLEKMMARSPQQHEAILREMDAYFVRDADRKLVGLPPKKAPSLPPATDDDVEDDLDDFIR